MKIVGRVLRFGIVAALVVAVGGWFYERVRFGGSDDEAVGRVQAELQQQVDTTAAALRAIAARAAGQPAAIRAAPRDAALARQLFDGVEAALPGEPIGRTGISLYDAAETPLAWAGRTSEVPRDRLSGPASLFVVPTGLGPRLLLTGPIIDTTRRPPVRIATIVVEQALGPMDGTPVLGERSVVLTSIVPVALRVGGLTAGANPITFTIHAEDGRPLVDAYVSRDDLVEARARLQRRTWAAVLIVLACTVLLSAAPLIDERRRARTARHHGRLAAGIVLALVLARAMLWFALPAFVEDEAARQSIDVLLTALVGAVIVWLAVTLIEGRRFARPHVTLLRDTPRARVLFGAAYVAIGLMDVALLWSYGRLLQTIVARSTIDLLHFSLHPLDASRLSLAFGLVVLHATVIWMAAAIMRVPMLWWRPVRGGLRRVAMAAWLSGAALGLVTIQFSATLVQPLPLFVALVTAGACAAALAALRVRARRASPTMRLGGLFVALLLPAMGMYLTVVGVAIQAKERLIADEYGPQALSQRDDLVLRLRRGLEQIDAMPPARLAELVAASPDDETATTDRLFNLWSQTELARYRLTSSLEIYRLDGRLVGRFAFNLPEYTADVFSPTSCDWDLTDDLSSFGASERHVLRASRAICVRGRPVGGLVVRAMLDYRTLPFISPQSPYIESLKPDTPLPVEGALGRDIEFVVYGWSRAPLYTSGAGVWPLPDQVFEQLISARDPVWEVVERPPQSYRVYFVNDRGGIYALGYPMIPIVGHLVNLAELVVLSFVLYFILIVGATVFNALASHGPSSGRALLREIRSSFYRRLFLAFWAGAVVPVAILAFATRTYFANDLEAGVEEAAAKTATVAQRLVEDYATFQQRGSAAGLEGLDDEIMVLVSRAIDEDVNLFDRGYLRATSERDLFASQLLSTRTPGDVYRHLMLDRELTYVGMQQVGEFPYLVAAAPVRAGGREGIVTVPMRLRAQETENQIDQLTRRLVLGFVLFSMLGGALGYWFAARLADPVSRLTRATKRIARGDLDARVAATSSDELGRLVGDFNRMAADLKHQRAELERTQRLEAWADMARQVAHDIKNPLTPIQLSAEHARRINLDQGRPLSPVLDECVNSILGQVRILRQLSSEFSSFASSPTPRPEPTDVAALVEEVVAPYRMGLADRIPIHVDAERNLPPAIIDRTLFSRALTNVIENALHAMPGKGRLDMTIRRTPDDTGRLYVRVADAGVGMDRESLDRIFEPYFSTKATGTGLGLTIAKRNVELNGGTIGVASERGVGTTVTMTLPV